MHESDDDRVPRGALWKLVEHTAGARGVEFGRQLTRGMAGALGVACAVLSEMCSRTELCTLAAWNGETWEPNFSFSAAGSPCGRVVETGESCFFGDDVWEMFPDVPQLKSWDVRSFLGATLRSASGEVIGTLCVMDREPLRDLPRRRAILQTFAARAATELDRIRSERELEEQRAFLRQVLDINPSLIFAKDREGRFTLVNKAIADAYGTTIDDLTGKTDAHFNPNQEEVAFFRKMDLEVMDTREERFIPEEPVTNATGEVRWVQTIKRPIVNEAGTADQVLGVATDITELKRTREELLARQLEEQRKVEAELGKVRDELVRQTRLAAIGQVAASIAHELRNPLGAISNAVFYLRRYVPAAEQKWGQYFDIIDHEIRTSDRIVTSLLEMSRAKYPAKQSVNLAELVWSTFDQLPGSDRASLRLQLDPQPFVMYADPAQLRQVFTNLITNSVQAMDRGGEITVEAHHEGEIDELLVRDDGPGVPATMRTTIFEPLFTSKAKGTGLGLAICRQIVERHEGTIEALAAERGAAFRIRLPAIPRPKAG